MLRLTSACALLPQVEWVAPSLDLLLIECLLQNLKVLYDPKTQRCSKRQSIRMQDAPPAVVPHSVEYPSIAASSCGMCTVGTATTRAWRSGLTNLAGSRVWQRWILSCRTPRQPTPP